MTISIKSNINNIFMFLPSIIYNLVVVCAILFVFLILYALLALSIRKEPHNNEGIWGKFVHLTWN
jgi:hypothetical protein